MMDILIQAALCIPGSIFIAIAIYNSRQEC